MLVSGFLDKTSFVEYGIKLRDVFRILSDLLEIFLNRKYDEDGEDEKGDEPTEELSDEAERYPEDSEDESKLEVSSLKNSMSSKLIFLPSEETKGIGVEGNELVSTTSLF